MAEIKTREDEHSPIVRKNQLEIVISNLSNEQQNQVSMIGRGISSSPSKIASLLDVDIKYLIISTKK